MVEILVWPDLAKFRNFSTMLKNIDYIERVHLVFGEVLSLFGQILYAFGQIFIVANGQIEKNNLVIWSHWSGQRLLGSFNLKAFVFCDTCTTLYFRVGKWIS